jgi:hypothetical protein
VAPDAAQGSLQIDTLRAGGLRISSVRAAGLSGRSYYRLRTATEDRHRRPRFSEGYRLSRSASPGGRAGWPGVLAKWSCHWYSRPGAAEVAFNVAAAAWLAFEFVMRVRQRLRASGPAAPASTTTSPPAASVWFLACGERPVLAVPGRRSPARPAAKLTLWINGRRHACDSRGQRCGHLTPAGDSVAPESSPSSSLWAARQASYTSRRSLPRSGTAMPWRPAQARTSATVGSGAAGASSNPTPRRRAL